MIRLPSGYLSISQAKMYEFCGEKYRRQYINQEWETDKPMKFRYGSAMHEVLEYVIWAEHSNRQLLASYLIPAMFTKYEIEDVELQLKSYLFIEEFLKIPLIANGTPLQTEKAYKKTLSNGIEVKCIVDLEIEYEGKKHLIDYKFQAIHKTQSDVDEDKQLTLCSLVSEIENVGFISFNKKNKKRNLVKYFSSVRDSEDHSNIEIWLHAVASHISEGKFKYANVSDYRCSAKNCRFWETCNTPKKVDSTEDWENELDNILDNI